MHLMMHLIKSLINILIKPLRILPFVIKNKGKKEKNELISKEIVKKAMYVYGMIISVILQRILKIISDDVCSCTLLIDSPATFNTSRKRKMVSKGIVSLLFKNVLQPFVSWHMVVRLIRSTNASDSVKRQLGHYLRRPTAADLQRLLDIGEHRGFPGMIGSIDCMHWEWKNCPTAWKGQYARGSGKPTIVLEAVASYDLWIWHAFFGPPGTLNDINVLDRSPIFDDIINGQAPQVTYSVNGRQYHLAYYLTDGIYPKWATLIQSIPIPQSPQAVLFAQRQEADKVKIGKIMRACIILHNMIVEDERDGYTQFDVSEFQHGEDTGSSHVDLMYSTDIPSNIANMMGVRTRFVIDKCINN
uniref:DDE Tnp4 domain-containing protein n=1 Tax=Brassica oleracea var. oleracea TaxID=109376 RepID=A0A0D3DQQ1_BRAOL